MKYSVDIKERSRPQWLEVVLADFDSFLQDHANCERKASAMAMSFVAKYPDRLEIIPVLIDTALEELEHFQQVYRVMENRGIPLRQDMDSDHYVTQLIGLCRSGRFDRFIDRMLVASVVECRGAERFRLIAESIEDKELQIFYKKLWTSEAKHGNLFVRLALNYCTEVEIYERLDWFMDEEAKIINKLELKPALH
ncbi:MAG: tRNA-(ms[2]io[6]A)-hydroxylase [Bacteroidetes bacterium]|nr:tRNA-(ms[2]io[6]A)-hydroxylase [Bacteroidota bacterium]